MLLMSVPDVRYTQKGIPFNALNTSQLTENSLKVYRLPNCFSYCADYKTLLY